MNALFYSFNIKKIRDKTEFENLAKLYVREVIKKECWDNMKVKGRGIHVNQSQKHIFKYEFRGIKRWLIFFFKGIQYKSARGELCHQRKEPGRAQISGEN